MNRTKLAGIVALVGSVATFSAQGAAPGSKGDFSVAAERLSGLSTGTLTVDPEGVLEEEEIDHTSFRFLWNRAGTDLGDFGSVPLFADPRIGMDYFIIDRLSIGGSLGIATQSLEDDDGDEIDGTAFLFYPRVGYLVMFSDVVGLWPRGGFTYMTASFEDEDGDEFSANAFALSAEVPLVISVPPAVITIAPTFDVVVAGGTEFDPPGPGVSLESDLDAWEFGIHAGLGVMF